MPESLSFILILTFPFLPFSPTIIYSPVFLPFLMEGGDRISIFSFETPGILMFNVFSMLS